MLTPLPLCSVMPLVFASAAYSVGVKSRKAMSIVPFCRSSFMVDDFE